MITMKQYIIFKHDYNETIFNHPSTQSNKGVLIIVMIIIINSKEQRSRGGQKRWSEQEQYILQGAVTVK